MKIDENTLKSNKNILHYMNIDRNHLINTISEELIINTVRGINVININIFDHIYVSFRIPSPTRTFWSKYALVVSMAPSEPKTAPYNTMSYTSIVSGCLKPFSAILYFFDFYHALGTLRKLRNLEKLAFLAILATFDVNW